VAALCPTIYGHELVKAGLLLSLFGGVRKHASSSNRVRALCWADQCCADTLLGWAGLLAVVRSHE
jgi:hypothetical protein